jgi:hypothetical protein
MKEMKKKLPLYHPVLLDNGITYIDKSNQKLVQKLLSPNPDLKMILNTSMTAKRLKPRKGPKMKRKNHLQKEAYYHKKNNPYGESNLGWA